MRIERFISGFQTLDGGTIHVEFQRDDGSVVKMGQDGRTCPEHSTHGTLFFGNSPEDGIYLVKDNAEENEVIAAILEYLDRNCATASWREGLLDGERRVKFADGNNSVELALGFLSAILKMR